MVKVMLPLNGVIWHHAVSIYTAATQALGILVYINQKTM